MRASITWCVLVLSASAGSSQLASAQDAKRLFFEADMVRHALEGQAAHSACLRTSSSARRGWPGASACSTRPASRWTTRRSRASSSNLGRPEAQREIWWSSAARHADGFLLVIALGDSGGLSDGILGVQGGRHRSGRSHTVMGAVQAGSDPAHDHRGRARHEAAIARAGITSSFPV